MTFNTLEKREIVFAMQLMINADNRKHPSEKLIFDCIYNALNISVEEALSFMSYFSDVQNNTDTIDKHFSAISNWSIDKRKDLISILTVLATIDKNVDDRENKLLVNYRIACGLSYTDYSMLEAMQDVKKYIVK